VARKILNTSDSEVIQHIKAAFESSTDDWYDHLPGKIKQSVAIGLSQSANGETIPHAEVMKKYKKLLGK
jgi:hypothetical protein